MYDYFAKMFKHFENDETIQEKIKKRLHFLNSPCLGLAYILKPVNAAKGFFFDDDKTTIIASAEEFSSDQQKTDQIRHEMINFVGKMSSLPEKHQNIFFKMSAKDYWNIFGREEFPTLYQVANPLRASLSGTFDLGIFYSMKIF